jgi:hypothetical protein
MEVAVELSRAERELKRQAILCHRTQMALSRRRFLAHATGTESFSAPAMARRSDNTHPVCDIQLARDMVVLTVQRRRRLGTFASCRLLLAWDKQNGGGGCWIIPWRQDSGRVPIQNARTGSPLGFAQWNIRGREGRLEIPLRFAPAASRFFVKLEQPSIFFDAAGWREIPALITSAKRRGRDVPARRGALAEIA